LEDCVWQKSLAASWYAGYHLAREQERGSPGLSLFLLSHWGHRAAHPHWPHLTFVISQQLPLCYRSPNRLTFLMKACTDSQ
jgi:hypothetical protein